MMNLNLLILSVLLAKGSAQFTCTFSGASNEQSCVSTMDDSNDHCVWCSLGASDAPTTVDDIGFCIAEIQAEAMEKAIPNIECDRYSGDDDDAASDDKTPTDDATPSTDDEKPTDDDLPDDYWKCLQVKKEKECESDGCTWCDTKAGFSLCMAGPTADAAEDSDWFTCKTRDVGTVGTFLSGEEIVADPLDTTCAMAYLQDQTEHGCVSTVDNDGNECEWCSLSGVSNICLTKEQAEMSAPLGISCDTSDAQAEDPYDPSCLVAFIQDQSKDACASAVDADGAACEYCTLQGSIAMCLTSDQAEMGEQLGVTCDEETVEIEDPYDPSCALAYLQDSSKDGCVAAVDADGNPCEFCSLQGALEICLTAEQAEMGEQIGITCDAASSSLEMKDPYDPSCALAYLQDPSKDACEAAVDSDGNACEFCSLQDALEVCLNAEQAEMGEQIGMTCDTMAEDSTVIELLLEDTYDTTCMMAYLQGQTQDACTAAVDSDGNPCQFCGIDGAPFAMCLNAEQAEIGASSGMVTCTAEMKDENVSLPADFFECLENYKEGDCRSSSCTWCNTEVGMGFCLSPAVADTTKQCTFFDCEFGASSQTLAFE